MSKRLKYLKVTAVLLVGLCALLFSACGIEKSSDLSGSPGDLENVVKPPQVELSQQDRLIKVIMEEGEHLDGEYRLTHDTQASNRAMLYSAISYSEDYSTIIIDFYYGGDTIFIGMGEAQYKGFMEKDSFTFTDVAGATSLAQSVGELTMAALQFAITDIDGVLSGFDSNLDFKNAWFA